MHLHDAADESCLQVGGNRGMNANTNTRLQGCRRARPGAGTHLLAEGTARTANLKKEPPSGDSWGKSKSFQAIQKKKKKEKKKYNLSAQPRAKASHLITKAVTSAAKLLVIWKP